MAGGQAVEGARTPAFKIDIATGTIKIPGRDRVGKSSGPPELIAAHAGRVGMGARGGWKPGFVESIADHGVMETVVIWKDGDGVIWCVDGVQRLEGAEEALKLRKARGDTRPMLVPVLSPLGKVDDVARFALSLSLNHLRHDDPPLIKAQKAAQLYKMAKGGIVGGRERTHQEALLLVANAIGEGVGVVGDMLMLDSAPADQKAEVAAGTLQPTVVTRLQSLPTDVQGATIKRLRATGPVTADRVREAVTIHKATRDGTAPEDVRAKPATATLRDTYRVEVERVLGEEHLHPQAKAMLAWVLGEGPARDVDGLSPILKVLVGSDAAAE